jgi:septum formation protein
VSYPPPGSPRLILASASPRRQDLLKEAGYAFVIHPANVDEDNFPSHLTPTQLAEYLANKKAHALAKDFPHDVILAADTVVALGSQQLGKPTDASHARQMLSTLSGTTHHVITGVAVLRPADNFHRSLTVTSTVQMRKLTPAEIDAYVATHQWQGKAGGYGIQDHDPFVTNMGGSLTNIVGLPIDETADLLRAAGISPIDVTNA